MTESLLYILSGLLPSLFYAYKWNRRIKSKYGYESWSHLDKHFLSMLLGPIAGVIVMYFIWKYRL